MSTPFSKYLYRYFPSSLIISMYRIHAVVVHLSCYWYLILALGNVNGNLTYYMYLPPLLFESSNFCLKRVDLISQHPLVLCRKLFAAIQNRWSFKGSVNINLILKWKIKVLHVSLTVHSQILHLKILQILQQNICKSLCLGNRVLS